VVDCQQMLEAEVGVYQLCQLELAHRAKTGAWLAAGPSPKFVPPGFKVAFGSDPGFKTLGFKRDQVLYQYQVVVQDDDDTALCFSRGDLDNDGFSSTFSITARPDGRLDRMLISDGEE